MRGILAALLVAVLGGATAFSQLAPLTASKARLSAPSLPLYVPSGRAARLLSVGHASTLADILFLWSIQHFSQPAAERADRLAWLKRVYGTITDLDPKFQDAYWLGYVSILLEGQDIDAAFAFVDKALENDPSFTLLAIEAGITARKQGRPEAAVRYLDHACTTGDKTACRVLMRVREAESAQDELGAWSAALDDQDRLTRHVAQAHVDDLVRLIESSQLSALVECYRRDHAGLSPGSLAQLVAANYIASVPLDPDGKDYAYDVRTGAVTPAVPYRYRPPSNSRLGVDLSSLGRCAPGMSQPLPPQGEP